CEVSPEIVERIKERGINPSRILKITKKIGQNSSAAIIDIPALSAGQVVDMHNPPAIDFFER
ncbi:MAG: hypothetical protein HQK53_15395, partial [Oligoflexia bacterium]|nr:hypothetical protein [Oligoflexia bacterium]